MTTPSVTVPVEPEYTATDYLRLIAEGWEVIESTGSQMTIQNPEDDGPQDLVIDVDAMLSDAPVREEGGAVDASAILEMAAKAVEDHQKQGREWVKGSLWDDLTREASGRIRALKSQLASRKEAPPQATNAAFMARAKHLLDLAEKAEAEALDGDEGCVWPVEALRSAYADLIQPQAREADDRLVEVTWTNGKKHTYVNLSAALSSERKSWRQKLGLRIALVRYLDGDAPQALEEAPAEAGEDWSRDDIETLISDALTDSFDVDWDAGDGAMAVLRALEKEGLLLRAQPPAREDALPVARKHLPECWGSTSFSDEKAHCFCPSENPEQNGAAAEATRIAELEFELSAKTHEVEICEEQISRLETRLAATHPAPDALPVPVTIFCPNCALPHVDEGEWATTRHHKTHQCQGCGHEWRPFPFATVGVAHPAPDALRVAVSDAMVEAACSRFVSESDDIWSASVWPEGPDDDGDRGDGGRVRLISEADQHNIRAAMRFAMTDALAALQAEQGAK